MKCIAIKNKKFNDSIVLTKLEYAKLNFANKINVPTIPKRFIPVKRSNSGMAVENLPCIRSQGQYNIYGRGRDQRLYYKRKI